MSTIPVVNYEDAVEMSIVPEGEYTLCVSKAEYNEEKHRIDVEMDIEGEEFAFGVRNWLNLPSDDDNAKQLNGKKIGFKMFFEGFDISKNDQQEPDLWIGKRCKAMLKETEFNGQRYNRVARYLGPA